jgi:hypothetical protein
MQDAGDASGGETETAAEGIIPPCRAANASFFDAMVPMYNHKYPSYIQPFLDVDQIRESFRVGRDSHAYGRLGPILMAAILPKNDGGFKTYCCNYGDHDESQLYSPSLRKDHISEVMEKTIRSYPRHCTAAPKMATRSRSALHHQRSPSMITGIMSTSTTCTSSCQLLHMAKEAARHYGAH